MTGEAERFYAALVTPARVGIEATIATQCFEKMLSQYGHELWFGDAAEIRAAMVHKQKTDDRDALHILDLLIQNRFPRGALRCGTGFAAVCALGRSCGPRWPVRN